jgi:hypothetical protein
MTRALLASVSMALWLATSSAFAQAPSVLMVVTKQEQIDSSSKGASATVYYDIKLVSPKDVPQLQVKYALLVKYYNEIQRRVVEGTKTCSLQAGQSFTFSTKKLKFKPSGDYMSHLEADIEGYAVEAFVGGQRVAADIRPPQIKAKIDEVRADTKRQKKAR